jgi:hypothetical protein
MSNSEFWRTFKEVDSMLKKQAFIQMPGGNKEAQMGGDPATGGMPPPPPGDPAAGGMPPPGMDPAMMGGDPAAMGMPPPGDPAAMGGMPPMDPAMMAGGMPPGGDPLAGGGCCGDIDPNTGEPYIKLTFKQLFALIDQILKLATKLGNGGQQQQGQQAAPVDNGNQELVNEVRNLVTAITAR